MGRSRVAHLCCIGLLFVACDDAAPVVPPATDGGGGAEAVPLTDVLSRLANDLMTPAFVRFADLSLALEEAVDAWAATPSDTMLRDAAREAWLSATLAWQRAELMQVGPAGAADKRVGGADLRDRIYSWPTTRPYRIDQALLDGQYAEAGWLDGALYDVQGLDALEYLLFVDSDDNACPDAVRINREGLWDAEFGAQPELLAQRRAEYAAVVAAGVNRAANELVMAFGADGGFAMALAAGAAPYTDPAHALDEVFAALFYSDTHIKDAKLGRPLGIADGCDSERCPDAFESRYSGRAAAHLAANLESFEALFFGTVDGEDGPGFDDLLVARDAGDLASRMAANLVAAREAVVALGPNLPAALETEPLAVEAAHAAVRTVTTELKGDVVSILDLAVPREGAGDAD